jgi:serine phosphatase RsbU (regulator of sigma subunit)
MLDIQFGAAKVNKYASRESGDTVEIVERPTAPGGFTLILADGQGSGRNAKTLSQLVTTKCVSLIKEGVRDGVVARAVSDHLYAYRHGQVSATLNLLTVDFVTHSLVITRNNPEPTYLIRRPALAPETSEPVSAISEITVLDEEVTAIGIYPRTRPVIREVELEAGLTAIAFSDGISGAGARYEEKLDVLAALQNILNSPDPNFTAQSLADQLLELAINQDRRRPQDDMSVIVVTTHPLDVDDGVPLPRRLSLNVSY